MSDEEKKAIEKVKRIIERYEHKPIEKITVEFDEFDYNLFKTLLNLIEKQSKEIEEIKEKNIWLSEQNFMMSKRHFNDSCKIKRLDRAMTFMLQDLEVEKKGYSIKEMKKAYFSRTDKNVFLYKGE